MSAAVSFAAVLSAAEEVRFFRNGTEPDICTGFARTVSCAPESSPTLASVTWDDKLLTVEVTAVIQDGRKPVLPPRSGAGANEVPGPFKGDCLEFFVQPDPSKADYYHFAAGPSGLLYAAKGRNTFWKHNAKVSLENEDEYWKVTWRIPWQDLGIKPVDNMKMKFNICRNYRKDNKVESYCFAALEIPGFHNPDAWRTGVLKRKAAKAVVWETVRAKKNLLANPEFDEVKNGKVTGWSLGKGAERVENMALSNEWIIRCSGKAYGALSQVPELVPGRDYTLHVRARKVGENTMMGIILLWRRDDGRMIEKQIVWKAPLTDDYREYRYSFTAPENPNRLIFYRLNPSKDGTDAVDYAGIHLYEGKSDPFEVRPFAFFRIGMKRPIPGTGPVRPDNPYGMRPEKMRVLAICRSLRFTQDVVELMKGLNVQCDRMAVTGTHWDFTPDIYFSDGDNRAVMKNIMNNKYDLYMVSESTALRLGPELQKILKKNVESGAGIWFNNSTPQPLFGLKTAGEGRAALGKGRILRTASGEEFEFIKPEPSCETERLSRLGDVMRMLYQTAGKKELIREFKRDAAAGKIFFTAPAGMKYVCTVMDINGKVTANIKGVTSAGKNGIAYTGAGCAGKYFARLRLTGADGRTLDYSSISFTEKGVTITVVPEKKSYTGRGTAGFDIKLGSLSGKVLLKWQICDWSGRILDRGSVDAAPRVHLDIPIDAIETNYAELRLQVFENGKLAAFTKYPFVCRDRDRKRQTADFTMTNWDSSFPTRNYAAQMEYIGMDNGIRPGSGFMNKFAAGFSSGGDDRAWPHMGPRIKPENGVRQPSLADPVLWNKIEKNVRRLDRKEYHYGLTFAGIVDEAGLSSRMWKIDTEEVDCHPLNVQAYRKAMEKKYGTIAAFNAMCGTNYSSFAELGPIFTTKARSRKNFAEFIEWRNYNTDHWISKIRRLRTIMDETDPELPLCLYNSFGPRALDGTDYWKLLTKTGIGFSLEYTSLVRPGRDMPLYDFDEVFRSFRPDMRVWGFIGYAWSYELARFQPWWLALHRYGGLGYFSMTACDAGTLLTLPDCELTQEADALRKGAVDTGLLSGFGKLFLDYQWAPRDIAVLWSHPSLMVSWCLGTEQGCDVLDAGSSYRRWQYARHCVRYLLEELLYQYDFVPPEKLGDLKGRKLLILPYSIALSDKDVENIRKFISAGGTVIADTMPGTYSEIGVPRGRSPFADLKNDPRFIVTGREFNDRDAACRASFAELLKKAGVMPVVSSPQVPRVSGREAMHFVDKNMHIFAVIRNPHRASDKTVQTFKFPVSGHIYDLRSGKYLGSGNQVKQLVMPADTALFGVYPYQVKELTLDVPGTVRGGKDLVCNITAVPSKGKAGRHLFHVEVVPPDGRVRRRIFTRNLSAPDGSAKLVFRMACNDQPGVWKVRATDIMTGKKAEKTFKLTH